MSVQEVEAGTVLRVICDGPGCGVPRLAEVGPHDDTQSLVPYGWYRIALGGRWVQFHDSECVSRWLQRLSIEQRDSGGGWIVSGIGNFQ